MYGIIILLTVAVILQNAESANSSKNSSVLLKRCSNNQCFKSKESGIMMRNPSPGFLNVFKNKWKKVQIIPLTNCTCVPFYCCAGVKVIGSNVQIIDLRFRRCVGQTNVCCYNPYVVTTIPPTTTTRVLPTVPTTTTTTTTTTRAPPPPINCVCVPANQCDPYGYLICPSCVTGQIDPRQSGACTTPGQVCCKYPPVVPSCLCMPIYQCSGTDYYQIDPRFGYTSSCGVQSVMCCRSGISANLQASPNLQAVSSNAISLKSDVKNVGTALECICTKSWQCPVGDIVALDAGIDPRFGYCSVSDEVCCRLQRSANIMAAAPAPQAPQTPYIINGPSPAPPPSTCGRRGTAPPNTNPSSDLTYFAEFPWMVTLLLRQSGMNDQMLCGASMINTRAVLTAAHCIFNRPSGVLVARFGEWDTRFTNESLPFQEANVKTISTHPQYNSQNLYYDVAVLILDQAVTLAANVAPICLPASGMVFAAGTRCFASGWGRNAFGDNGQYQTILRKVDLPIVDNSNCQFQLRQTRLGPYFNLHGTFICAGGEINKDTCQGDGGGPLVCPTANGQYIQAGIVSWGIGCGASSVPAVYASVAQLRTWIDQQLATYGAN